MNVRDRDERQSADAVTGRAEALDRWEDEGGVGREDTPSQRRDEPPSLAREVAEPKGQVSMIADPSDRGNRQAGHPSKGADATNHLRITVAKR